MKTLPMLALLLAARLSAQQLPLPSPYAGLGFEPGTDSVLADWGQITTYLTSVAQASPFVRLDTLGRTTLGRPFLLLTITSPANQRRLEELKRGQRLLADPRGLTPATLAELRVMQPAVVLIDNNIHSTEIASSLMGLTLAYQLATDPALTRLLDSVVVLIVPSMNPDGLDTVVAWYRKYKGTAYEGGPLPWLYHAYVGHDNNRDWFMLTQAETRLVTRVLYHEWFPEVAYDVHQMGSNGPRLFLPPFADPVNPNLDPMLVEGTNLVGTTMASALYDSGYTGVAHQVSFDLWWHGGFRSVPARHNMIGILSEAASVRLASPITLSTEALRQPGRGVNYPGPWPGGTWRIGDIARYELVAAEALVRFAAHDRVAFIDRFVALGRRAVEAGREGDPFAYLLPPGARDPEARARLATVLLQTGLEVQRAESAFTADGRAYPVGTLVVPMAQPFRAHAKDLLEPQQYPMITGQPPYDVAGWTLPLTMNVPAVAVRAPFTARLTRVDTVTVPPGRLVGSGDVFALDNQSNGESSAIAALLAAGQQVTVEGDKVVVQGSRTRAILADFAARRGFSAERPSPAIVGTRGIIQRRLPRIAIYQPWTAAIDEGWTRWLFEQYGVPYTTIHDGGTFGICSGWGNVGVSRWRQRPRHRSASASRHQRSPRGRLGAAELPVLRPGVGVRGHARGPARSGHRRRSRLPQRLLPERRGVRRSQPGSRPGPLHTRPAAFRVRAARRAYRGESGVGRGARGPWAGDPLRLPVPIPRPDPGHVQAAVQRGAPGSAVTVQTVATIATVCPRKWTSSSFTI